VGKKTQEEVGNSPDCYALLSKGRPVALSGWGGNDGGRKNPTDHGRKEDCMVVLIEVLVIEKVTDRTVKKKRGATNILKLATCRGKSNVTRQTNAVGGPASLKKRKRNGDRE